MARIKISPELPLALIAEAAGQPDPEKRFYRDGFLEVQGVTQGALEHAAANPPDPPIVEPSEIEILLFALEKKVGLTVKDKEDAKNELTNIGRSRK